MERIKITDSIDEMISIGEGLIVEKNDIYTSKIINLLYDTIGKFMPNASETEKNNVLKRSVYDYWVYGASINEEFYYGFLHKNHIEKSNYITFRNRFLYVDYLNPKLYRHSLDNKYELYLLLKPYFQREVIELTGKKNEFDCFLDFINRHPQFVLKPQDLASAIGVRLIDSTKYDSVKDLYDEIIEEGKGYKIHERWGRGSTSMLIEELIIQHNNMAAIHPFSVNILRINTLNIDGDIKVFYPWVKFGAHNNFVAAAATLGCCVGVDENGVLNTDGFDELGNIYSKHPDTGIQFKGYKLLMFNEAIELAKVASRLLPNVKYIGWDLALTQSGWCIVEGNTQADFVCQLVYQKGCKQAFENAVGWKPTKMYWWE